MAEIPFSALPPEAASLFPFPSETEVFHHKTTRPFAGAIMPLKPKPNWHHLATQVETVERLPRAGPWGDPTWPLSPCGRL